MSYTPISRKSVRNASTGAAIPPKAPPEDIVPAGGKVVASLTQRVGFFNMAKVMREYQRARNSVVRLNERKARMAANLVGGGISRGQCDGFGE